MPDRLLTLPDSPIAPLSIRAKALVFHDPASLQLLQDVERIARSEATVLVTGETGTGKELIAQLVHIHSGRAKQPMVRFNCAALSPSLAEMAGLSQAEVQVLQALGTRRAELDARGELRPAAQHRREAVDDLHPGSALLIQEVGEGARLDAEGGGCDGEVPAVVLLL